MALCWRFIAVFCAATFFQAGEAVAQSPKPGLHAFIVANSDYVGDAPLVSVRVDGTAIGRALASMGYAVHAHDNVQTSIGFNEHYDKFIESIQSNDKREAVAVVYFSGHSIQVDDDGILAPTNLTPRRYTEIRLAAQGMSLRHIFEKLAAHQRQMEVMRKVLHVIFIIDACRKSGTKDDAKDKDKPCLRPMPPPAGQFALYATSADEVAHTELKPGEPPGTASVYTRELLKQLAKPLSLQSLARLVRWEVSAAVAANKPSQPQTPAYFDSMNVPRPIALTGEQVDDSGIRLSKPAALSRDPGHEIWECEDCPHLVVVPKGLFKMGERGRGSQERSASAKADDADPRLDVTIREPFAIGITEVTIAQFRAFLADVNEGVCPPDHPACARQQSTELPVTGVSWTQAQAYVEWLNTRKLKDLKLEVGPNSKSGFYRLPTEAEWEYAARADSLGSYTFGNFVCSCDKVAKDFGLSEMRSLTPVQSFSRNGFGLYDVHGNVWEWVADCWSPMHDKDKVDGGMHGTLANPDCPRVAKGGSWLSRPGSLRLARRVAYKRDEKLPVLGFRVVRELPRN